MDDHSRWLMDHRTNPIPLFTFHRDGSLSRWINSFHSFFREKSFLVFLVFRDGSAEERKDTFDSNILINREPGFAKVPINFPALFEN